VTDNFCERRDCLICHRTVYLCRKLSVFQEMILSYSLA